MRTIDNRWGELSAGYQAICQFDQRLRQEWGQIVRAAQHSQNGSLVRLLEERRARIKLQVALDQPRYQRRLRHYQAQMQNYLPALHAWQRRRNRSRLYLSGVILLALFMCTFLVYATVFAQYPLKVDIPIAILFVFWVFLAFRLSRSLSVLGNNRPPEPLKPEVPRSMRQMKELEKALAAQDEDGFPLSILPPWWDELAIQDMGAAKDYGSLGVNDLLQYFAYYLPDNFIAFRELLVHHSLDADVLIIGSGGVWILEVKHFAGQVTYRRGKGWEQHKPFYQEGGVPDARHTFFENALDVQWLREKNNIERTIRRRLPSYAWLIPHIHGGIAFTHPEVQLDIGPGSQAVCRRPDEWLQEIGNAPNLPRFSLEDQLKVADALLNYANTIEPAVYASRSAVELARCNYEQALAEARASVGA